MKNRLKKRINKQYGIGGMLKEGFQEALPGMITDTALAASSVLGGAIGGGRSTEVGNLISSIPGLGILGGTINRAFGSNINLLAVAGFENANLQLANLQFNFSNTSDLLSLGLNLKMLGHIKRSDVGSDGWFNHKASNKAKELNAERKIANMLALSNFDTAVTNLDLMNDFQAMLNMSAYGGPINMRTDAPMSPFGNRFDDGGPKRSYSDWSRRQRERWGNMPLDEFESHPYDYRGFYEENPARAYSMLEGNPDAHFTDKFKKSSHPTFSEESIYSGHINKYNPLGIEGGKWNNDGTEYTSSRNYPIMPWDIENTLRYTGTAESRGFIGRYPDGSKWKVRNPETGKYERFEGQLPMITITPNKKSNGGGIHIKKANRGKFTESANKAGMGVQEYARHILANKDDYSSTLIKRANFARNFGGNKKANGGYLEGQVYDIEEDEIKRLLDNGYEIEYV